MPTLVSTGQITIVDNNDAKPLTAFIAGSTALQQVYTKDESTVTYIPNWASTPITLTAKVYVGGTAGSVDITALLTNKKWSNDLVTSIGSATTLVVNTNLTTVAPVKTYYFEGDYTDPNTGLISHVIAQIGLSLVQTGTNAVYVQLSGQQAIEQSSSATKNTAVMKAELIRASGVDDTGITYRWFKSPFAAADQIDANLASVTTQYGFRTTAQANAGSGGAINSAIPADGTWADVKAIIISETAVNSMGLYKVEVKDADGAIYQAFFTIYDVSDPYTVEMISTAGDKLQNGVGSTDVYPEVYYGANKITDLTNWSFKWMFYDKDGVRASLVDTSRTAVAGGRNISANTAGAAAVITYDGAAITFANNDIVKLVTITGVAKYYEVASGTGNTVTLRVPATLSTWLTWAAPALSEFVGGKLFVCAGTGATAGTKTTAGGATGPIAKITVTGDEIDVKGSIMCEATRP
jgi:hypothetical protein